MPKTSEQSNFKWQNWPQTTIFVTCDWMWAYWHLFNPEDVIEMADIKDLAQVSLTILYISLLFDDTWCGFIRYLVPNGFLILFFWLTILHWVGGNRKRHYIDECGSKIVRNRVFDCLLSSDWRQMAIENTVSSDFLSAFVDSYERFRLPPTRCVFSSWVIDVLAHLSTALVNI